MNARTLISHTLGVLGMLFGLVSANDARAQSGDPPSWSVVVYFSSFRGNQNYRVEAFATGVVTYEGIERVRTMGPSRWRVPPQVIRTLAEELVASGVFSRPTRQEFFSEITGAAFTTALAVRLDALTHSLVYQDKSNPEIHRLVQSVIEKHLSIRSLRCPYEVPPTPPWPGGGDLCSID